LLQGRLVRLGGALLDHLARNAERASGDLHARLDLVDDDLVCAEREELRARAEVVCAHDHARLRAGTPNGCQGPRHCRRIVHQDRDDTRALDRSVFEGLGARRVAVVDGVAAGLSPAHRVGAHLQRHEGGPAAAQRFGRDAAGYAVADEDRMIAQLALEPLLRLDAARAHQPRERRQ
jgi:hypothetical protein